MRTISIASAACAPLSLAAITIATAATAVAANPTVAGFGAREQLPDAGGAAVTGYSISELRSSSDAIPYPVSGQLYEVTAGVEAVQGTVTPIVSNFNARATDGATYRALYNVATPQGVNPSALAQGAKSTGKIYFDVTGAVPTSVVYNDGAQDLLIWTAAAPSPGAAPLPARRRLRTLYPRPRLPPPQRRRPRRPPERPGACHRATCRPAPPDNPALRRAACLQVLPRPAAAQRGFPGSPPAAPGPAATLPVRREDYWHPYFGHSMST